MKRERLRLGVKQGDGRWDCWNRLIGQPGGSATGNDAYPDSTLTTPAPYFRKTFRINKPVKQAKAYICGLGFYEMYLNGERVGDQVIGSRRYQFRSSSAQKDVVFL